jgi:hypothetical protein
MGERKGNSFVEERKRYNFMGAKEEIMLLWNINLKAKEEIVLSWNINLA